MTCDIIKGHMVMLTLAAANRATTLTSCASDQSREWVWTPMLDTIFSSEGQGFALSQHNACSLLSVANGIKFTSSCPGQAGPGGRVLLQHALGIFNEASNLDPPPSRRQCASHWDASTSYRRSHIRVSSKHGPAFPILTTCVGCKKSTDCCKSGSAISIGQKEDFATGLGSCVSAS